MRPSLLFLACAYSAWAYYEGNLNYGSPSLRHPSLGIAVHKVMKRNEPGQAYNPSQLNFTHGVASGDPYPNSVILWTRISPMSDNDRSNVTVSGTAPLYDHENEPGQAYNPSQLNFTHGVASGDPYPNSVILWTRISPMSDNDRSNVTVSGTAPLYDHENEPYVRASKRPVCVDYKVGTDEELDDVADSGTVCTSSDVDFTVKVEAKDLKPYTTYYYQFVVANSTNASPLGRTKTTPEKDDEVNKAVKLAVYSCSNYPFGFFNAYGNAVRKDSVDYVVHLGDYIYEYENGYYGWGNSLGRIPLPNKEIYSLYDYRRRLATYRTDLDLVASHQQFAWIPVWDDHEVADNAWRGGYSEMNNTEESFIKAGGVSVDQRKMNAVRAYFEWMPIRQVDMDDGLRIWRSFSIGTLFDLIMLDTRNYDRSITDLYWNTDYVRDISNEGSRTLMGGRQEKWFYNQLQSSSERGAAWRIIGNQIIFSRINASYFFSDESPFNYDQLDGYLANRNRTFQHLYDNEIGNNVFLAGDSHANWVSDLVWLGEKAYDAATGEGAIGVEFAGTAVSSPSPLGQNISMADANNGSRWLVTANPELQWHEAFYRGYFELSIDYDAVNATFFGTPSTRQRSGKELTLAKFQVLNGANKLTRGPTVGGGVAESGFLKGGRIVPSNKTYDTDQGSK